jgi:hypothetical protein
MKPFNQYKREFEARKTRKGNINVLERALKALTSHEDQFKVFNLLRSFRMSEEIKENRIRYSEYYNR